MRCFGNAECCRALNVNGRERILFSIGAEESSGGRVETVCEVSITGVRSTDWTWAGVIARHGSHAASPMTESSAICCSRPALSISSRTIPSRTATHNHNRMFPNCCVQSVQTGTTTVLKLHSRQLAENTKEPQFRLQRCARHERCDRKSGVIE